MSLHLPIRVQVSRKLHPGRGLPGNHQYWRSSLDHQVWCCWNTCIVMDGNERRRQTVSKWQKTHSLTKWTRCIPGGDQKIDHIRLVLMQQKACPALFPLNHSTSIVTARACLLIKSRDKWSDVQKCQDLWSQTTAALCISFKLYSLSDNHTGRPPNCLLMSSHWLQNTKSERVFFFPFFFFYMTESLRWNNSL